jgi:hypothetical protein
MSRDFTRGNTPSDLLPPLQIIGCFDFFYTDFAIHPDIRYV